MPSILDEINAYLQANDAYKQVNSVLTAYKYQPAVEVAGAAGMYDQAATGQYSPKTNKIVIKDTGNTRDMSGTLAHEKVHALQTYAKDLVAQIGMANNPWTGAGKLKNSPEFDSISRLVGSTVGDPKSGSSYKTPVEALFGDEAIKVNPYRLSRDEQQAFGFGNQIKSSQSDSYKLPPHVDTTNATETLILAELVSRLAKKYESK